MKLRAYSIYDKKVQAYHAPFFAATDGAATRNFQDLATDNNTTVGRHPADYSLYFVGEFDDAAAKLEGPSGPLHVVDAIALLPQQAELRLVSGE